MDKRLEEIKKHLECCHENISIEHRSKKDEYLCRDYDESKKLIKECKENHKKEIQKVVELLNNYISYPEKKILIFDVSNKVKWSNEKWGWTDEWIGYNIKIPYIDKQEYYCVKELFKSLEYINACFGKNEWVIG